MKMRISILIFTSFLVYNIKAQSKKIVYVDEYYDSINFEYYKYKLNSNLYDVLFVETDSITYKKLKLKEFYGKIEGKKINQLKKLFNKKYSIDTTKTWLIHYIDSIPDIKKMPEHSGIEYLDSLKRPTGIFLSNEEFINQTSKKFSLKELDSIKKKYRYHRHLTNPEDYLKNISREIKRMDNKVEFLHFYTINKGFPNDSLLKYKYFKDYKSIIKKFFSDKMKNYRLIIIKENGEVYASTKFIKEENQKKLIKRRLFNRQKKKWLRKIKKLHNKKSLLISKD